MTTPDTAAKQPKTGERFRLPDSPERELDEKMSTVDHLHQPGNTHHLAQHLGNPESTLWEAAARFLWGARQTPEEAGPRQPGT